MPSPDDLIKAAQSEIGYREGPNNENKFADEAAHANHQPWCVTFIVAMAKRAQVALPETRTAAVATFRRAFEAQGRLHPEPAVGDVAFFQRGESHASIVAEVHGDGVVCVGGNYSGEVSVERRRGPQGSRATGYGRPDYAVLG